MNAEQEYVMAVRAMCIAILRNANVEAVPTPVLERLAFELRAAGADIPLESARAHSEPVSVTMPALNDAWVKPAICNASGYSIVEPAMMRYDADRDPWAGSR